MVGLLLAAAALVARALFQAADAALLALGEEEVRETAQAEGARWAARWLLHLKQSPEPTAAALRAMSSGLLAFAAVAFALAAGAALSQAGIAWLPHGFIQIAAGVFAGALALVLDLVPRSLAAADPLAWGLALAPLARLVVLVLGGPSRALLATADRLLLRRGAQARYTPPPPPLEQIEKILSEESRSGGNAPSAELVHGLFSFAERTAKEVMVPRTSVVGVPLEASSQEVIDLLAEEGHTRMPIYDGSLDHIKGVLHAKDVIPLLANPELIVLQDLLRPALFIPWNKPVGELLKEMQQKRSHIAMVLDEFGGLEGIVTLEDMLALIVGELREDLREEKPRIQLSSDGSALVPGETRLPELARAFEIDLPEQGDYETVAGMLNAAAGAIPQVGDCFFVAGLELTVDQRDDRRVRQVRVRKPKAAEIPAGNGVKAQA
jgi:CBS domain containing-hemolysin-like protein